MKEREEKLITAGLSIVSELPTGDDVGFIHTVLSQIGLPRRKIKERVFERASGGASLIIKAGEIWDGKKWHEQPIPYGPKPRVMLMDLFTYALRHKTRIIDLGGSVTSYLRRLGWTKQGGVRGPLTMFKNQAKALAVCHMTLGIAYGNRAETISGQPIKRFAAWLDDTGNQQTLWPAALELSEDFWDSLREYAVPMDMRAVHALSSSALALDIYTSLTHRLHRLNKPIFIPWKPLREQFGQEYKKPDDFKKEFIRKLHEVLAVYPEAKVERVKGGLRLCPSPPPIKKISVGYCG